MISCSYISTPVPSTEAIGKPKFDIISSIVTPPLHEKRLEKVNSPSLASYL